MHAEALARLCAQVRSLRESRGDCAEAGPSIAVQMVGLNGVPTAGDEFAVCESEQEVPRLRLPLLLHLPSDARFSQHPLTSFSLQPVTPFREKKKWKKLRLMHSRAPACCAIVCAQ